MTSLRQHILDHFQTRFRNGKDDMVHSQTIGDWGHVNFGYKTDYVSRELRKIAEIGKLEAIYEKTKESKRDTVFYKYRPSERDLLARSLKL